MLDDETREVEAEEEEVEKIAELVILRSSQ